MAMTEKTNTASTKATKQRTWWKDGIVYQIWPASFKDSNGDGMGDLRGVIDSLDHIQSIGADIIWITPIFKSPQCDMGYDISDYEDIHEPYGTVGDVEDLISACHIRGMRLLLDLVVNHTSDQHAWFLESRSSKDNPMRNWYHWRPARYIDGERTPPNNWRSHFSGSAWAWDDLTQEYYLHLFASQQPDLNWECREMREAIYQSAMKFWLDKGVDGFRIDTITIYGKDADFPDAPILDPASEWQMASCHYRNKPRNFEHISEMNREVFSKYDVMTVGEYGPMENTQLALEYCSKNGGRINMGLQFETVYQGYGWPDKFTMVDFTLQQFRAAHAKWQQFTEGTDGWPTMFLENHDLGRSVSRFGCDSAQHNHVAASAKVLAMLQATASGTLFLYQGQEIGMTNCPREWPTADLQDVETLNHLAVMARRGVDKDVARALNGIAIIGRDNARTPMQWDNTPHAGFSKIKPWMRVHDNYETINVARQARDESSVLHFWTSVLSLRRKYVDLFAHGTYRDVEPNNGKVMAFTKTFEQQKAFVVLNFSCEEQACLMPDMTFGSNLVMTNVDSKQLKDSTLQPWEGRIFIHEL